MSERRNPDIARLLVRRRGVGTMATAMAEGGAPYASMVTYACDHRGQPVFLFSTLSDHTKNIAADPRASLLVEDAVGRRAPQTGPRVSLLGTVKKVKDAALRDRFLARHPDAALYADFGDFAFYRMTVERAHFVGGFARAIWFDAKHILSPAKAANAVAEMESGVISHMNADHSNAVSAYAVNFLRRRPGTWKMCGCDTDGIDLRADGRYARMDFHKPVTDSKDCRETLVAMAAEARATSPDRPT